MVPFEEAEKGLGGQATLGLPKLRRTASGDFFRLWCDYSRELNPTDGLRARPETKAGLKFLTKEVDCPPLSTSVTPCLRPLTPNSTEDSWRF